MSLDEFKELLLEADPKATKASGTSTGERTVWWPGGIDDSLMSDDIEEEVVRLVYVDRFTKQDHDQIAAAIYTALDGAFIPFRHEVIYENETGYIHHNFTCHV